MHKHNPNSQNNEIIVGFTSLCLHKAYALTNETTQILQYSYSNFAITDNTNIITNSVHFNNPPKTCIWISEQFRTFHSSLHESIGNGSCRDR